MTDSITRLHQAVLAARGSDPSASRTAKLLQSSRAKMAKKLAEEAVEVVIDAMHGHNDAVVRESADLIYNLVVLWVAAGVQPQDVWDEMARREKLMGIAEKLPKLQKMPAAPAARMPAASASRRKVVPIETARARKRR
jgi:phosphoribosyl-ATP pyrophosphohydrolase